MPAYHWNGQCRKGHLASVNALSSEGNLLDNVGSAEPGAPSWIMPSRFPFPLIGHPWVLRILVILLIGTPLILLELLRSRSKWVEEHHGELGLVLWFLTLFLIYERLLPLMGIAVIFHDQ